MNPINKTAMRAAVLIHEQLAGWQAPRLADSTCPNTPGTTSSDSGGRSTWPASTVGTGPHRGSPKTWPMRWTTAAANWKTPAAACNPARRNVRLASASDIYRDILALHDEFEEVEIDLDEHELSVTTDRIVLEDMNLGRFRDSAWTGMAWALRQPTASWPSIPIPAAKSEDVTHPHVQDELLCEGEGRSAIRAALAECRLHDFFMLVSQLLHTYGRGSAYVELDNWDGVPCDELRRFPGRGRPLLLPSLRGHALRQLLGILRGLWRFVLLRVASAGAPPAATSIAPPAWQPARCAASGSATTAWKRAACVEPVTTNNVTRRRRKMIRRRMKPRQQPAGRSPTRRRRRTAAASA